MKERKPFRAVCGSQGVSWELPTGLHLQTQVEWGSSAELCSQHFTEGYSGSFSGVTWSPSRTHPNMPSLWTPRTAPAQRVLAPNTVFCSVSEAACRSFPFAFPSSLVLILELLKPLPLTCPSHGLHTPALSITPSKELLPVSRGRREN